MAQPPDLDPREEIQRWVAELASPNYSKRELASDELKRLAAQSLDVVLGELETAEGEAHAGF